MLEAARRDAGLLDEGHDVTFLQADHTPELVRREVALVDHAIQRARVDAQVVGNLGGAHPPYWVRHARYLNTVS